LDLIECELGKSHSIDVVLENPTGEEVVLKSKSSNKINFRVQNGQRIMMPPFGQAVVGIEYTPS
jgi:hypothetical protein